MGRHPCYRTGTRDAAAPASWRRDDAMAFATARCSNNGGTARSVVGAVPPQPINEYGQVIMVVGTGRPRPSAAVPARLTLRLSSSP